MNNVLIFTKQEGRDDWKNISFDKNDLIIFSGAYFVSDTLSCHDLIRSTQDIINFKLNNDNVLLLLNEDDLQYIGEPRTGNYKAECHDLFNSILIENRHLFNTYNSALINNLKIDLNKIPQMIYFCPRGYFVNDLFYEFEIPKTFTHNPQKSLVFNKINGYKVGIFIPYMDNIDPKLVEAQKQVFDTFNVNINQILWKSLGGNPHSDFVNTIVDDVYCDFYVLFDIDSIPLRPDFLEILVERAGKTKILGAEQTTDMISNEPFAAPSCFIISKELYDKMGRPRFDPTPRSDDTQELTHLAIEQGIEVDFIKFTHCKIPNYYWEFKDGRKYGYGSYYEDLVFHNFQARLDKFTRFFFEECEKTIAKYS